MASVHVFIVRINRDAPGFRASARRVDEEVAGHFDQPLPLLEFLVGPADAPSESSTDGDCGPPADIDGLNRRTSL